MPGAEAVSCRDFEKVCVGEALLFPLPVHESPEMILTKDRSRPAQLSL